MDWNHHLVVDVLCHHFFCSLLFCVCVYIVCACLYVFVRLCTCVYVCVVCASEAVFRFISVVYVFSCILIDDVKMQ
jgi:hypothetical protein